MKQRFYAANDGKALLQVITTLGEQRIQISVGNNKLDWHTIILNTEQTEAFKIFMRENDVMSIISSEDLDKRDDDNYKKGWNAAIEAALKELEIINDIGGAFLIRKLRK